MWECALALAPALPTDACTLVVHHMASTIIQLRWLAHTHFRHARQRIWPPVRVFLDAMGVYATLRHYSMVRREWRTEAESWLVVRDAATIIEECRTGLWGYASRYAASRP